MKFFGRSGLRFDVWDSGAGAAETAVLLHGFPQHPSSFDQVTDLLNAQGVRTLVPSQRGYTPSARARGRRSYRMEELAKDVIALLDAADLDRAHLVGHDWGGGQAWSVAAWYPERVSSLTVLSTPHPAALLESLPVSTQSLRLWYMAFYQLPLLPEAFASRTLSLALRNTGLPPKYLGRYCDAMAGWGTLSGALNWYRGIPFSTRRVGPVQVPTTLVWGRNDFAITRAAAERTQRHVQAAYDFREVDTGHWLPEAEPAAVAEAVLNRIIS